MKLVIAALVMSVLVGVGIAAGSKDYFRRKAAEEAAEEAAAASAPRPRYTAPPPARTVAPTEEPVPEPEPAVEPTPVTPPTQPMSPEVMEVMANRQGSLQRCYATALAEDESLGAMSIEATFDLDRTGTPTNIVVTGGIRSVNQCVAGVIRRTTFPRQDEPLHTNYAFELPLE